MPPEVIINPPYSGSVIDPRSTSSVLLKVAGSTVDLSTSYFNLESLQVSYDGKELVFTEIPADPLRPESTFKNEDTVELQMNLGEGLKKYFTGKIRRTGRRLSNRNAGFLYKAVGTQLLANDCTIQGANGSALYMRYSGTHVMTRTATSVVYASLMGEAMTEVFTLNALKLQHIGIPFEIGTPGPDYPNDFNLPWDYTLQNTNFYDGILSLSSYYPSIKPFFDDLQEKWTFPNMLTAPEYVVDIRSCNVVDLSYEVDTSNRWTRVQLQSVMDGRSTMPMKGMVVCQKGWNTLLEPTWCMQAAASEDPRTIPDTGGYSFVYRRWKIPMENVEGVNPNAPICAYALFQYGAATRYVALNAYIDIQEGWVVTETPVIIGGNAWDAGRSTGPTAVVVTWWNILLVPTWNYTWVSVPTTIFTGSAYEAYGVARTKYEMVDAAQVTASNAAAKLSVLQDAIISGQVVLEGDPIEQLLNLNSRVLFYHPEKSTGLESVSALLTSYTYTFGKRGQSTLELTTDLSGLVRVN